jgi:hypothetical protein
VNLNSDEAAPDADLFDCDNLFPFTSLNSFAGRGGDDRLSLHGEGLSDDMGGFMTLRGGTGDDTLVSGPGDDVLRGDRGGDTLNVTWSDLFTWIFAGGQGTSNPHPGLSNTAIGTDIGEDQIFGFERFLASDFGNQLFGSARAEVFIAGDGDDVIWPGGGGDIVVAGEGTDLVSFESSPKGIRFDLRDGAMIRRGTDGISGVENVEGSAFDVRSWAPTRTTSSTSTEGTTRHGVSEEPTRSKGVRATTPFEVARATTP